MNVSRFDRSRIHLSFAELPALQISRLLQGIPPGMKLYHRKAMEGTDTLEEVSFRVLRVTVKVKVKWNPRWKKEKVKQVSSGLECLRRCDAIKEWSEYQ